MWDYGNGVGEPKDPILIGVKFQKEFEHSGCRSFGYTSQEKVEGDQERYGAMAEEEIAAKLAATNELFQNAVQERNGTALAKGRAASKGSVTL
ncbi:hypothetical protein NDU88_005564 [Pleurodeles waltl]|uniref:Uncharacterized protein n=1 Tax=Pleurodeles waltl TaxID=8319 RepID=A0AAV7MAU6_PLEWA|nr:hypothetical protein NDU88_005564 [Pleurodeles waltl]